MMYVSFSKFLKKLTKSSNGGRKSERENMCDDVFLCLYERQADEKNIQLNKNIITGPKPANVSFRLD